MSIELREVENTGYMISKCGTKIVAPSGVVLSQRVNNHGYRMFHLKKPKSMLVHRAVAIAWIKNDNVLNTIVNHKDEDCSNNHMDNLEWCTIAYNNSYGTRMERIRNKIITKQFPLEYYETHAVQKASFQRACKRRGLEFDDFTEVFGEFYHKSCGKKQRLCYYIKKEVLPNVH